MTVPSMGETQMVDLSTMSHLHGTLHLEAPLQEELQCHGWTGPRWSTCQLRISHTPLKYTCTYCSRLGEPVAVEVRATADAGCITAGAGAHWPL
jgi:hypothetical protein